MSDENETGPVTPPEGVPTTPAFANRPSELLHPDAVLEAGWSSRQLPSIDDGAAVALGLAIASYILCPLLPAIGAVAIAPKAKRRIRSSGGALRGESMATAAQWLGWCNIAICLVVAFVLFVIIRWALRTTGADAI